MALTCIGEVATVLCVALPACREQQWKSPFDEDAGDDGGGSDGGDDAGDGDYDDGDGDDDADDDDNNSVKSSSENHIRWRSGSLGCAHPVQAGVVC